MARNQVTLQQVVQHNITRNGYYRLDHHRLVEGAGTCNGQAFESLFHERFGLDSSVELFSAPGVNFSQAEYQSIRRAFKKLEVDRSVPPVHDQDNERFQAIYNRLWEKYHGIKVPLAVPFERKDEAKALGAQWDGISREWFVWSLHQDAAQAIALFPAG